MINGVALAVSVLVLVSALVSALDLVWALVDSLAAPAPGFRQARRLTLLAEEVLEAQAVLAKDQNNPTCHLPYRAFD